MYYLDDGVSPDRDVSQPISGTSNTRSGPLTSPDTLTNSTTTDAPRLYQDEHLEFITGHPCIYKYILPKSPRPLAATESSLPIQQEQSLPLIVLIPGGAHNGRIYYGGHDGYDPTDHLAFWLSELGFPALAISYPLESEPSLMPPSSPGFRIATWGRQAASVTCKVVQATPSLQGREILLVGWSMGGRILAPFTEVATRLHGLRVSLFISLAATPGVAGLRPPPPGIMKTERGYATCNGLFDSFARQVGNRLPIDIFWREYYGDTPISLHGWRLSHHAMKGGFVPDRWESEEDATPTADDFSVLPWMATIVGTGSQDARHVLTDRIAWEYINVQRLTSIWEKRHTFLPNSNGPRDVTTSKSRSNGARANDHQTNGLSFKSKGEDDPRWGDYSAFVHGTMPGALTRRVTGNHYFFLGAQGAKATAESIAELWKERCDLDRQLWNILSR